MNRPSAPVPHFGERLKASGLFPFFATTIATLQINVGRRCNLSCKHCHLEAGPRRTESMSRSILERCLEIARDQMISVVDITGGSPEMHPELSWFIGVAAKLGKRLIVRSNLTILKDPAYAHCIDLYSRNNVEIVGSLPDLRARKTDRQRGRGVFSRTMEVIRLLNARGYGMEGSPLTLNLAHNPVGAFLPGCQKSLEEEYKRKLWNDQGVRFNRLLALANNPCGRYLAYLIRNENYAGYMTALANAFCPDAAAKAMCRSTLSVAWDGRLYDCDFNQALDRTVDHGAPDRIENFDLARLSRREVVVGDHCYACTAGAGSSCLGAISSGDNL
ncbi:MAG: arsenosugar biosynthesis radical SAM protein ArsS [Chitinivibrionales bacterium]|nr:arsenosugar biosynthesis radical SAM protein ArsS [Chitinivibrionales bacterium]